MIVTASRINFKGGYIKKNLSLNCIWKENNLDKNSQTLRQILLSKTLIKTQQSIVISETSSSTSDTLGFLCCQSTENKT